MLGAFFLGKRKNRGPTTGGEATAQLCIYFVCRSIHRSSSGSLTHKALCVAT